MGWGRGTIWALTPLRGMEIMHQYRFCTDKYSVYASCTMRGMDTCTARCFPRVIGVRVRVMPSIQALIHTSVAETRTYLGCHPLPRRGAPMLAKH